MNIVEKLSEKGLTLSVVESCTGGKVAAYITDFAGSSEVFTEGVVTYANEAKVRLGVPEDIINKYGAVSAECAKEMASAVKRRTGSNIAVSTTGIAGPGGGTDEKPVGLVYSCILTDKSEKIYKFNFDGSRSDVRNKTVEAVVNNIMDTVERDY
ncbi:MAG: CinA family protein [Clostridia bacterium]|nr:CinA family protein [Clostridia bacterium]